jgi:hypothetical protein
VEIAMHRLFCSLSLLVACALLGAAEGPEVKKGYESGVVTAVDASKPTLTILADGGYARTYIPQWSGGMPNQGGSFDPEVSAMIRSLCPGDRVDVAWKWEERYRAVQIRRKPGEAKRPDGEPRRPEGDGRKHEGDAKPWQQEGGGGQSPLAACLEAPQPEETHGKIHGTITQVDPKGRLVLRDEGGCEFVMVPKWKDDLGAFDPDMVKQIAQVHVGQEVAVHWEWDERQRITELNVR